MRNWYGRNKGKGLCSWVMTIGSKVGDLGIQETWMVFTHSYVSERYGPNKMNNTG